MFCRDRDRLVDLMPPTGLSFDGSGYAATYTREVNAFYYRDKFDISLKFKTFSEDGIMFFLQLSEVSAGLKVAKK